MTKVFIGSTSRDLAAYREAAINTCLSLDMQPIAMEHFEAMAEGAIEGSLIQLDRADLYVGIFAFRYGYIEKPKYTRSVTEIEFDYAGNERGLDRLCFIADPKHPFSPDSIDPENFDLLKAFKERIYKVIVKEFTTVDDFAAKLAISLANWKERHPGTTITRYGSLSATLTADPDDVPDRPPRLIGREKIFTQSRAALDQAKRVLLHGFGGMGKTSIAAALAQNWINDGKGSILWIKAGSDDPEALFEALARPFNLHLEIARTPTLPEKIKAVRGLLRQCGATLLVIDDAWQPDHLRTLIKAVPDNLPVLITSRHKYPLDPPSQFFNVDELPPSDALQLLEFYASADYQSGPKAAELCRKVGYHAYALMVAGKLMLVDDLKPSDLLKKLGDSPHKSIAMPLDYAESGRENFDQLLEVSLNALSESDRAVFMAFGGFFAPVLTAELLNIYFDAEIDSSLNELVRRGLLLKLDETPESRLAYKIHDLA